MPRPHFFLEPQQLDAFLNCRWRITEAYTLAPTAPYTHQPHVVPAPKIILVRAGRLNYVIDGKQIRLKPGMMLFRPAFTRAEWRVTTAKGCRLDYVEFAPEETHGVDRPIVAMLDDVEAEAGRLARIAQLFHEPTVQAALEAELETKLTFVRLCRRATSLVTPTGGIVGGAHLAPRAERAVRVAIAWLTERFSDPGVMVGLPERCGLSEDYFRIAFKRSTGVTAQDFLLRIRMRAARMYLASSGMSVKEVARAVGYEDPLYFSRVFRQTHGHPPVRERHTSAS